MNSDTSLDINTNSNPVQTVAQQKEDYEMLRATDKITALYCRLSVEDTKDEKQRRFVELHPKSKGHVASIRTRSPLSPPDIFH